MELLAVLEERLHQVVGDDGHLEALVGTEGFVDALELLSGLHDGDSPASTGEIASHRPDDGDVGDGGGGGKLLSVGNALASNDAIRKVLLQLGEERPFVGDALAFVVD